MLRLGWGKQGIEFARDREIGARGAAVEARFAVSATATVLPPAHTHLVQHAHLAADAKTIRQRDHRAIEQLPHSLGFAGVSIGDGVEEPIIEPLIADDGDLLFIPAGVNGVKTRHFENERQRLKPAQPIPPLIRPIEKFRVGARVHGRMAVAARSQPATIPIGRVVQKNTELVIAAQGQGRAALHHVANDPQRFANGRAAVDVISEKYGAAKRVTMAAGGFAIAETRQQIAQSGRFAVDVTDDVEGIIVHTVRLRRSVLGKQGRLCNDVDWMDKFPALFAKGGLSLDRLRTLCLVAEAGSLTAAAERDPGRVSLFSRQLRELETFFGARLVRRRGRRIALTDEGRELAELARRQFIEMTDFARRCDGEPLEVTVGAGASVMEWILVPRLPALRLALRSAQLKFIREGSETLAARLRDLRIDVGIIREDAVLSPLKTEPFMAFGYALYVPRSLAGPPRMLRQWLPRIPMVSPTEGWARDRVDGAIAAAGLRMRIEFEGVSTTLAMRAVREGHYAAILPEIASAEIAGADVLIFRPSFLRKIERRLVIAWHPRQVETREVIAQAVEAIKQLRGMKLKEFHSQPNPS
jgi:DNA-binding transcriptional LysR family regulator